MTWTATRQLLAKNKVKLLLNMCVIAGATIPRGGVITVEISGEGDGVTLSVTSRGTNARLAAGVRDLLAGTPESGKVDAHSIQPYFTGLVARECGMEVDVVVNTDEIALTARTAAAAEAAPAPVEETAVSTSA